MGTLVTTVEAAALGFTVTEQSLIRASERVRGFTEQTISDERTTIIGRGPIVKLPQRPTIEVHSVTHDGVAVPFTLRPGGFVEVAHGGNVEIDYSHGFETLPGVLVELICTIAERLDLARSSSAMSAVASGVQTESAGNEALTYGFDSLRGISGLLSEEKAVLRRLFPPRGGVVVMRP